MSDVVMICTTNKKKMKKQTLSIKTEIRFADLEPIMLGQVQIELSPAALKKISACRQYLNQKIEKSDTPVYGINTGFGSLCNTSISKKDLSKLQENLVVSHACGMGNEVRPEIVRLMMVLKIQALSLGHSGVQTDTVQLLADMYNNDILPVVYEQGSLGASGDLAPLAHMSLPLIGKGDVVYQGNRMSSKQAFKAAGLKTVQLQSKEGLALLNGTQFMSAHGAYALVMSKNLMQWANHTAALSLEAFDGRTDPFHPMIQAIRPHPGQMHVANAINKILKGSKIASRKKEQVQDPYSFRCVPQVHGATWDTIQYVSEVFKREVNSVTDNPTVFPETDLIISAGNFHGQPLALAFDFLGIAMAELANISERRIYQLINGKHGLPNYLVANPGLNSGFMIPQYSAASIVSQNKQLATPASVDSIESSQGQEDHVSMGANAATKTIRILENVEKVLAIELMTAAQALEFRRPGTSSAYMEKIVAEYRTVVPFIQQDDYMSAHMHKSIDFMRTFKLKAE
ncbi:Histidine ammonia-lyase [bioreactor metagenome]|uniref:histidine ammonia-lyase n=1 Tax=bioreactor metagenome TaxID=1076179 RepID=A0A644YL60_9ZZZZ